jgi:hypothetical protein
MWVTFVFTVLDHTLVGIAKQYLHSLTMREGHQMLLNAWFKNVDEAPKLKIQVV